MATSLATYIFFLTSMMSSLASLKTRHFSNCYVFQGRLLAATPPNSLCLASSSEFEHSFLAMAVKFHSACTCEENLENASVSIHTMNSNELNIHVFIFLSVVWCCTIFNYMLM